MPTPDRRPSLPPLPDPLDGVTTCPDCRVHVDTTPYLVAAVHSVAISHGTSSEETLRRYLAVFHRRGHRDETQLIRADDRGKISDGGGGEQR